jgi:superfamily II DNA or RNA helicase
MLSQSYIGSKGYTIVKSELSPDQYKKIKNDLKIKPFVAGSPMSMGSNPVTFSCYRENDKKIYVPRYYGIEKFGTPKKGFDISEGLPIDLKYNGELRENQPDVVNAFFEFIKGDNKGGGLLELPCGFGKTCLSLYILSKLSVKTLIIVHTEGLLNQWIDRINDFLPGARIGKIQGDTVDIHNKDIVVGMLQSLYIRNYESNIFKDFGFTIIDEVHHISSEKFSNSLFKIVTRYTLGLSATMNRKDGTSYVFKMFLGPVIFKGKRQEVYNVEVRAINYISDNDNRFNEVVRDYRGNVQYSTMISKLCEYLPRSNFILDIIVNLFKENDKDQQVMVLAHNRSLLTYLHDKIVERKIADGSVGYYLGGMKPDKLKETSTKKIVIATYSMAAEGLDIKTLSTLILATPRTEVQQSVGRILRDKHDTHIVVDIIDIHPPFKNQWKKRKTFYNKEKYKIVYPSLIGKEEEASDDDDEDIDDVCLIPLKNIK